MQVSQQKRYERLIVRRRILAKILADITYFSCLFFKPGWVILNGVKLNVGSGLISPHIKKIIYKKKYEGMEIAVLRDSLKPDDTVMEIGGGIGYLSCFASLVIKCKKITTYEANPQLIPLINTHANINNVNNLEVLNAVVGNSKGISDFYLEDNFYSSSTIQRGSTSKLVKVPSLSICEELERIDPTYLIIDMEGGEAGLIDKLDLKNGKVRVVLVELHPQIIGNRKCTLFISAILESGFYIDFKCSKGSVYLFRKL